MGIKFKNLFRRSGKHKVSNIMLEREHILTKNAPFSIIEEYKTLRTNIQFSTTSGGCKVIGTTSSDSGEGKSITCLNMAITFAETDARVLLIDADLRKPKIARLTQVKAIPGLSNVLVNMNTLEESIQTMKYGTYSIDLLPSGDIPPNPSELLGSNKMKDLIKKLSADYDYIFIDTPPIGVVADAVILSSQLTGLVFVVRAGETQQESVQSAVNQLKFADANILGFVLNGIHSKGTRQYSAYRTYRESPHLEG